MELTRYYPERTFFKDLAIGTLYQYIRPGVYTRATDLHRVFSIHEKRIKVMHLDYLKLMTKEVGLTFLLIKELTIGKLYYSNERIPVEITIIAQSGNDDSSKVVIYNELLEDGGKNKFLSEKDFLEKFYEMA